MCLYHAANKEMTSKSVFRQRVWCESTGQVEMDANKNTKAQLVPRTKNVISFMWRHLRFKLSNTEQSNKLVSAPQTAQKSMMNA